MPAARRGVRSTRRSGAAKVVADARREAASARHADREDVVGIYKRITGIVWQRLSPTFGIRTINAIARNVIARRSGDRDLRLLEIGPDGLIWTRLEARLRAPSSADRLQQQLDDFIGDFFEALANLVGRLMVGKIFKEAEELARKGDDR